MAFEYTFVRIGIARKFLVKDEPKQDYQAVVKEHGKRGWRLVQVFAPPTGTHGTAAYFELIFERPA
jgi:hypothetical protein